MLPLITLDNTRVFRLLTPEFHKIPFFERANLTTGALIDY